MIGASNHAISLLDAVLQLGMIHGMMSVKFFAWQFVASMFIGADHCLFAHAFIQNCTKIFMADAKAKRMRWAINQAVL